MKMVNEFKGLVKGNSYKVYGFVFYKNGEVLFSNELNFKYMNGKLVNKVMKESVKKNISEFKNVNEFVSFVKSEYEIVYNAYNDTKVKFDYHVNEILSFKEKFENTVLVIEDMLLINEEEIDEYNYEFKKNSVVISVNYFERINLLNLKCESYLVAIEKHLNKVKAIDITLKEMNVLENDDVLFELYNKIINNENGKFEFIFKGGYLKTFDDCGIFVSEKIIIDTDYVLNFVGNVANFDKEEMINEEVSLAKLNKVFNLESFLNNLEGNSLEGNLFM